jgi:N6-L-threonylcarbamoyladenine synthase
VEKLAAAGEATAYDFPRALGEGGEKETAPFSFSGLKTSLRYRLQKMSSAEIEAAKPHLCASYQAAVVDQLIAKTESALHSLATSSRKIKSLGLSGGVANNQVLRHSFKLLAQRHELTLLTAEPRHTGDNAAMIAFAAWADSVHTRPFNPSRPAVFEPSLPLV